MSKSLGKNPESAGLGLDPGKTAVHFDDHLVQDGINRLAFNKLNVAKRYKGGDFHICLKISRSGDTTDYDLVFYAIPLRERDAQSHTEAISTQFVDSASAASHGARSNDSMFVGIASLVQRPEEFVSVSVWLERHHQREYLIRKLIGASGSSVFHFGSGVPERESATRAIPPNSDASRTPDLIQGTTQIANSIENDAIKHDWHRFSEPELMDMLTNLRIEIDGINAWVICEERLSVRYEISNVMLCSCKHVPWTFHRVSHDEPSSS
jgi:hypothetical protein